MVEGDTLKQITQLYGVITRCYNQPVAGVDLNLPQCQVLGYVAEGPLSVAQVADKLGFSANRTSNLVVNLYRRGYLQQQTLPKDRRRRYLTLTAAGQAQLTIIERELPMVLHDALQQFRRATK